MKYNMVNQDAKGQKICNKIESIFEATDNVREVYSVKWVRGGVVYDVALYDSSEHAKNRTIEEFEDIVYHVCLEFGEDVGNHSVDLLPPI